MREAPVCPADCPDVEPAPGVGRPKHRFVVANGIRFHTVQVGSGPLVLLLHGFPEFWYGWRHQLGVLPGQLRVVAPDLPGYNLTDESRQGYRLDQLAGHVGALIRALGVERVNLVGHDWGGVIAWYQAMWAPELIDRLAILNAPHPAAYLRELRRNNRQRLRSWYVLYFQLPWLPERLLRRDSCRPVTELLRRSAIVPETFSDADLLEYRRAICRPGRLTAALSYYRALGRQGPRALRRVRAIQASTLLIWGERDAALVPELAEGLEPWVPDLRVVRVPGAGHWVQHERPDLVNAELGAFFNSS